MARAHHRSLVGAAVAVLTLAVGCTSGTNAGAGGSSGGGVPVSTAAAVPTSTTAAVAPISSAPAPSAVGTTSASATATVESGSGPTDASRTATTQTATSTTSTTATTTKVLPPVASVAASPAFGSTDLSPSGIITVKVSKGTIQTITVTNATGKVVQGALSADKTTWTLGEVLGFGKIYTAAGTALGTDGKNVPIKGTFAMLGKDAEADSNITPGDGDTVGIAQPIIIRFPAEPADRAAIEKSLTVTTTPRVEGSWAWIHHDDAWGIDWRPKDYWPAGTKVHVAAKLYGLKIADGLYGATDLTSDFTIGRAQIVYADARKFNIVVKQGCQGMNDPDACTSTVATYDGSYGSGDDINDPNRVTRSGIHVVNELLPVHVMSNPAYGYTHSTEYWDVRISDNGEFIHENANTVGDQGNTNVSHGCINLSAASAQAYFKSALIGDPVEVSGTSVQLGPNDGDLFDWTISWSAWQGLSAL